MVVTEQLEQAPISPRRPWLAHAVFLVWLPAVLVPGAYLMASHLVALPAPIVAQPHGKLERAVLALSPPVETSWRVAHFLSAACACSARVAEHLLARGPRPGTREHVLFIAAGPAAPDAMIAAVSLVDVSVSTLTALNVRSMTDRKARS